MRTGAMLVIVAALTWGAPSTAAAQAAAASYRRDVPARLAALAKISEDSARTIALAQVPGGAIQALELEREHGVLIYSWEVKVPGTPGITEVHVSAIDGRVLAVAHEGH